MFTKEELIVLREILGKELDETHESNEIWIEGKTVEELEKLYNRIRDYIRERS